MGTLLSAAANAILPNIVGQTDHEKWTKLAQAYPAYALPWMMLAKANPNTVQLQKAALFVPDILRLHWLLNQEVDETIAAVAESKANIPDTDETDDQYYTTLPENNPVEPAVESLVEIDTPQLIPTEVPEEKTIEVPKETPIEVPEETPLEVPQEKTTEAPEETPIEVPEETSIEVLPATNAPAETEPTPPEVALEPSEERITETPTVLLPISTHLPADAQLFTPFHLVDYFASQGIKLDINDIPKTGFDKKLMTFTQWLKTMKKVNFEAQAALANADPAVDAQAKASLFKEQVITEAMANVLAQQGKKAHATQVYLKLILLHPEKTALFAARIHDLNK